MPVSEGALNNEKLHAFNRLLNIAGLRALATSAGLLQLCRELELAGVLAPAATGRIRQAMFDDLMDQAPPAVVKDAEFADRLQRRLANLFAGVERVSDEPVLATS
jgi:hypothetical protein